ncbi:MAG: helix-turn-helix domain-containing protein [Hypericibacter sp.]
MQILRHQAENGEWELLRARPDPRLREQVHRSYNGWVENARSPVLRPEAAKTFLPVILNWGPAFGIRSPGNAGGAMAPFGSFLGGPHDTHVMTEALGRYQCLQVNFTPLGAYRFLGMSMHSLANRVVSLEDLLGREAGRLVERLHDAKDWETRFTILDGFIAERIAGAPVPAPEIVWALKQLGGSGGNVAIGALATDIGWSRKRLIERFHEQVGLAPKTFGRIIRFNRVIDRLGASRPVNLADIAVDHGYYDQAHLNRDFRQFAGCSPTSYFDPTRPQAENAAA